MLYPAFVRDAGEEAVALRPAQAQGHGGRVQQDLPRANVSTTNAAAAAAAAVLLSLMLVHYSSSSVLVGVTAADVEYDAFRKQ